MGLEALIKRLYHWRIQFSPQIIGNRTESPHGGVHPQVPDSQASPISPSVCQVSRLRGHSPGNVATCSVAGLVPPVWSRCAEGNHFSQQLRLRTRKMKPFIIFTVVYILVGSTGDGSIGGCVHPCRYWRMRARFRCRVGTCDARPASASVTSERGESVTKRRARALRTASTCRRKRRLASRPFASVGDVLPLRWRVPLLASKCYRPRQNHDASTQKTRGARKQLGGELNSPVVERLNKGITRA
eukprot:253233-Prorocentrum_minimum.AAC.1